MFLSSNAVCTRWVLLGAGCSRYHTSFELLLTWWSAEPVVGEASPRLSATLMYFAHRCGVGWVLSFGGVSCLPVSSASSRLCVLQLLSSLSFLGASCASSLAFERVSFTFDRQRWLQARVDLGREHSSGSTCCGQKEVAVPGLQQARLRTWAGSQSVVSAN